MSAGPAAVPAPRGRGVCRAAAVATTTGAGGRGHGRSRLAGGISAVRARDSAFGPQTLTTFADQVYSAVAAAWSASDASSVRPVLADALWDPMAAAITSGMASGLGMIFGLMRAHASLVGV